jgi:hypothetical protein
MKNSTFKIIPLMGLILFSCTPDTIIDETSSTQPDSKNVFTKPSRQTTTFWDFNQLTEWEDASLNSVANYSIENGNLNMFTSANTWERTKVKTISSFDAGNYTWRVYIPEMGVGDKTSIGAFLYANDTHEVDFEIGYGTQSKRAELNAETDDLVVYMTSQGNPFHSEQITIKRAAWYTLTINLTFNSKKRYVATWKINDSVKSTAQLNYGKNTKFAIYCSVENLNFIGDHIPENQNYALFDWVEFISN